MLDTCVRLGAMARPDVAPVLALDDIHAGYGQFQALFGLSLEVPPGRALAIVGHNGMGKTTVARVASGPHRARPGVGC